jgi:hypothetical protein
MPAPQWSEVLISGQLMKRPERPILSTFTNAVVVELDRLLSEQPQDFMAEAARAAKILPGAHSAGVSLVSEAGGPCHARAVEGRWTRHRDSVVLLDRSLCPLAVREGELLLLSRPQRACAELDALYPPIEEALLAPFSSEGHPAGVVWAVFHDARLQFDIHDGYMLEALARQVGEALPRLKSLGKM